MVMIAVENLDVDASISHATCEAVVGSARFDEE